MKLLRRRDAKFDSLTLANFTILLTSRPRSVTLIRPLRTPYGLQEWAAVPIVDMFDGSRALPGGFHPMAVTYGTPMITDAAITKGCTFPTLHLHDPRVRPIGFPSMKAVGAP